MKRENWGLLHHGIVIYLDMSVEDIYSRLSKNPEELQKRPLLQGDEPVEKLRKIRNERQEQYSQVMYCR